MQFLGCEIPPFLFRAHGFIAGKRVGGDDAVRPGVPAEEGIITTKPNFIRRARELKMFTVMRLFVIDSMALAGISKLESVKPDFIEVLPGVMPKTIRKIAQTTRIPLLAGGLISDKEDVMAALGAGAMAVSATSREVWRM